MKRARVLFSVAAAGLLLACVADDPRQLKGSRTTTDPTTASDDGDENGAAPKGKSELPPPVNASPPGGQGTPTLGDAGTPDAAADAGGSPGSGTPSAFDAFQQQNLDVINTYRAQNGAAPLALDAQLSAFAVKGTNQLTQDHVPHGHFVQASQDGTIWQAGFKGAAAENQGDPNGWYKMSSDPTQNELLQIDSIQKAMFDEGPGGGHYETMMDPKFRRVGVGLVMVNDSLYLTNDYSD